MGVCNARGSRNAHCSTVPGVRGSPAFTLLVGNVCPSARTAAYLAWWSIVHGISLCQTRSAAIHDVMRLYVLHARDCNALMMRGMKMDAERDC